MNVRHGPCVTDEIGAATRRTDEHVFGPDRRLGDSVERHDLGDGECFHAGVDDGDGRNQSNSRPPGTSRASR